MPKTRDRSSAVQVGVGLGALRTEGAWVLRQAWEGGDDHGWCELTQSSLEDR